MGGGGGENRHLTGASISSIAERQSNFIKDSGLQILKASVKACNKKWRLKLQAPERVELLHNETE